MHQEGETTLRRQSATCQPGTVSAAMTTRNRKVSSLQSNPLHLKLEPPVDPGGPLPLFLVFSE